jgi:nucleotide-binding universal stress UspA family protein
VLRIENILFPTDFSKCAGQALKHALFLAVRFRARLHMLHLVILHQENPHNPAHTFPYPGELQEILKKMATERMSIDVQATNEDEEEIDVVFEQLRGFSASNLILKYADEHDIDLIVTGTHGRRGLGCMFLGSIAQEVVRQASCPVYTIRESENHSHPNKIKEILSPIDFSGHSKEVLSVAKGVAKIYDARLQLLHVLEDAMHPAFQVSGKETIMEINPDIIDSSQEALKRIFEESPGPDVNAELKVVAGHAVNEILDYVQRNSIDLIVIATRSLSGLKEYPPGRIADKLILRAACPVLTVKASGKPAFRFPSHLVRVCTLT